MSVLSIGKLSLGQEAYYLQEVLDGAEDYYLSAGEAPGRWLGHGAELIGIAGEVSADELRAILGGTDPTTGAAIRATPASLPGLDLTLSAPKSVSLVWGLGDHETARATVECHERAVDAAVTYLESYACQLRRGHAGAEVVPGQGFVAAGFRHRTSRLGDPALHTHVLVANLALGDDGRWTALDARPIYRHARTAGFVYQATLRYELARSLGLLFEEVAQGYADVAGVPEAIRREFSGRRRQILDAMERHGATSAKAAQAAALETRTAKGEHVPESELRDGWAQRAETLGFELDELPRLIRTPVIDVSVEEIAARVTEHDATYERRDVVRAVAQAATQGASLDQLEHQADAYLASPQAVPIVEGRWTTPEILELEGRTVESAAAGQMIGRGMVPRKMVAAALAERPSLGVDQRRAVRAITTSGNAVDVLVGPAGTGKTFSLDAARAAWEAAGFCVLGTALAARAAAELEHGAGIPAQTSDRRLAALAMGRERFDERTVLLVDEAGMLGTRRLAALVAEASAGGSKVVLVGDPKQLPEIDAGGLFASLATRLGHVELTQNRRQRDPQERATVHELRVGKIERAMGRMERNGRITVGDNADLLRDALVGDWLEARAAGDHVVMVAAHRSTVSDLNDRARRLLRARGDLGDAVLVTADIDFSHGDQVVALRNDYGLGLLNGDRGVVRAGKDEGLTVELDDGRRLEVPVRYIDDGHLAHGYAVTVHKSQGITCDRALVLGDDSFTIELGYTSLTRGRDRNQLYVVASRRDESHGRAPARDPIDAFRAALGRSGAKTAAIDAARAPTLGR
jgi:conjugative relaxase-like TrwC/TraI family protein